MIDLSGRTAVVTGGTDGIGAATALRLHRHGADVTIIGRSQGKADALVARAASEPGSGSMRAVVADFSHMSRFVFLEAAARHGLLHPGTRLINIAASAPKVPFYARMEFTDLTEVEARVGMRSHGQAQLANDLLTAQAPARYGITAVGYGPGSVDTNIRREIPTVVRAAMTPFFAPITRTADQVAAQLTEILADPALDRGTAHFYGRKGSFPAAAFIADVARQRDLLRASTALARKALGDPPR